MKMFSGLMVSLLLAPSAFAGGGTNFSVDDQVLARLHLADQAEIAVATLIVAQAPDKAVTDFAQSLINDHNGADAQVTQLAAQANVDLNAVVQAFPELIQAQQAAQTELAQLQSMKGIDLERAFLQDESQDHKDLYAKLVAIQPSLTKTSDVAALVIKLLPVVKQHGDMADQLLLQLGH